MSYPNRKWKVSFLVTDETGDADTAEVISFIRAQIMAAFELIDEDALTIRIEESED